jgi:hypothetical protein
VWISTEESPIGCVNTTINKYAYNFFCPKHFFFPIFSVVFDGKSPNEDSYKLEAGNWIRIKMVPIRSPETNPAPAPMDRRFTEHAEHGKS